MFTMVYSYCTAKRTRRIVPPQLMYDFRTDGKLLTSRAARDTIQSYIAYRLSNGAHARPTSEAAAQFSYQGPQSLLDESLLGININTSRAPYTTLGANGQPITAPATPTTTQYTHATSAQGTHTMHQQPMNEGAYPTPGGATPSDKPSLAHSAQPQQAPHLNGYSLPAEMPLLAQLGNLAAGSMSAEQYASCMYILQQQYLLGRQQALLENRAQADAHSNDLLRALQPPQGTPTSQQPTMAPALFRHAGTQAASTPRAAENRSTPHSAMGFNPLNLGTTSSYPSLSTPPQAAPDAHNLHNAGYPTRPTALARQASAPASSSPVQTPRHHQFTPLPPLSSYSFDAISMVRICPLGRTGAL